MIDLNGGFNSFVKCAELCTDITVITKNRFTRNEERCCGCQYSIGAIAENWNGAMMEVVFLFDVINIK